MAVGAISNSLATTPQALRHETGTGATGAGREKAKGSEGGMGAMPKPTVNTSGQTIGTIISTTA